MPGLKLGTFLGGMPRIYDSYVTDMEANPDKYNDRDKFDMLIMYVLGQIACVTQPGDPVCAKRLDARFDPMTAASPEQLKHVTAVFRNLSQGAGMLEVAEAVYEVAKATSVDMLIGSENLRDPSFNAVLEGAQRYLATLDGKAAVTQAIVTRLSAVALISAKHFGTSVTGMFRSAWGGFTAVRDYVQSYTDLAEWADRQAANGGQELFSTLSTTARRTGDSFDRFLAYMQEPNSLLRQHVVAGAQGHGSIVDELAGRRTVGVRIFSDRIIQAWQAELEAQQLPQSRIDEIIQNRMIQHIGEPLRMPLRFVDAEGAPVVHPVDAPMMTTFTNVVLYAWSFQDTLSDVAEREVAREKYLAEVLPAQMDKSFTVRDNTPGPDYGWRT